MFLSKDWLIVCTKYQNVCVCLDDFERLISFFYGECDDYVEYSALIYTHLLISFWCPVIIVCGKM